MGDASSRSPSTRGWDSPATVQERLELVPPAHPALNASCPQSEWREGFDGKLHGPWQHQHVLELVDPVSMDGFSYPASTIGGTIAVTALRDSIIRMRQFRGDCVYPIVQLSHCPMKTRYGGRERPYFIIKTWIRLGGDGAKAVSATPPVLLPGTVASVTAGAPTVSEPTLREEVDDRFRFELGFGSAGFSSWRTNHVAENGS